MIGQAWGSPLPQSLFNLLSRKQRWLAVAVIGAAWFLTGEGLLVLLLLGAGFQAVATPGAEEGDTRATVAYGALVAVLSALGWAAQQWTGAALAR